MELPALQSDLNSVYGLGLPATDSIAQLTGLLAEKINAMVLADFEGLIQLLYRIDVNEARLKKILKENSGTDAGLLIAQLILERQWQKIESRRKHSR